MKSRYYYHRRRTAGRRGRVRDIAGHQHRATRELERLLGRRQGATVDDDQFTMVRKVDGPIIRAAEGRYYLVSLDKEGESGTFIVFFATTQSLPDFRTVTAYAKGGMELRVVNHDRDYVGRYVGYSMSASIEITDEIATHAVESGSLHMQVSFGHRDFEVFVPANYFIGFSSKALKGWGACPKPPVGS